RNGIHPLDPSCKRKIWECVGPAERQRYLEYKQKKQRKIVVTDKENAAQENKAAETKKSIQDEKLPAKPDRPVQEQSQRSNRSAPQQPPKKKSMANQTNIQFKVNALKVLELRKELQDRGESTAGLKKDLRLRLLDVMLAELAAEGSIDMNQPVPETVKSPQRQPNQRSAKEQQDVSPRMDSGVSDNDKVIQENEKKEAKSPRLSEAKKMSIDKNEEQAKSQRLSEAKRMSIDSVQPGSTTQPENNRDSISSMQVEHHSTTLTAAKRLSASEMSVECVQESSEKSKDEALAQSSGAVVSNESDSRAKNSLQNTNEQSSKVHSEHKNVFGSNPKSSTASSKENDEQSSLIESSRQQNDTTKNDEADAYSDESDDDSVSPPPSELSTMSKASGQRVRELASRYGGSASVSSAKSATKSASVTSAKSATKPDVTEAWKKVQEQRMANAKMREKAATTSKKVAHHQTTKEQTKTESRSRLMKDTAAAAYSKKDQIAAKMREKTAAQNTRKTPTPFTSATKGSSVLTSSNKKAYQNPFMSSASKFGSFNKNYLSKSHGQVSGDVQDSLGQTVKKHPSYKKQPAQSPMDT
ncbi:MAG: hypothetical protein SGILL_009442, partial [Bacillariaceae sp.]